MLFGVSRFQDYTKCEEKYSGRNEAIQFKTSCDLRMKGFIVFCGGTEYAKIASSAKIKVLRLINDDETNAEEIGSIDEVSTNFVAKTINFKESILVRANIWHVITGTISGSYVYSTGGKDRMEKDGMVFEFRNSKLSEGTNVTIGQFPNLYFEHLTEEERKDLQQLIEEENEENKQLYLKDQMEKHIKPITNDIIARIGLQSDCMQVMQSGIDKLCNALNENSEKSAGSDMRNRQLFAENESLREEIMNLKEKIVQEEQDFNNTINEQSDQILNHQAGIDKLRNALTEKSEKATCAEIKCRELITEIQQMRQEICDLKQENIRVKLSALQGARGILKFNEKEKIPKLLICIQLENGTLLYFDNNKPFELFTMINDNRVTADLKVLEGEYDCSFKGTIGNCAYFSAVRGKTIGFIKASIVNGQIVLEKINELKISDLILFNHEPLYFIEESAKWIVYQNQENYLTMEGEIFDVSEIRLIRKYEPHYHRGFLYFFRENSTAILERINDKVVIVEGPILDGTLSFYNPPHSDFIYIANSDQNALVVLNTTNLNVSQQSYEPPIESTYHSIVGAHEGILTMLFEGKAVGRCLMTTKLF